MDFKKILRIITSSRLNVDYYIHAAIRKYFAIGSIFKPFSSFIYHALNE